MADEGLSRHFYEKNHLGLKCRGGRKHGALCDGVKTASTKMEAAASTTCEGVDGLSLVR